MNEVTITVEGYFEVLVAILQSIAFVFQGQVIPKITGALALLYFLVLIFRHSINNKEVNPFGEIVLICFMGIMFVGGTSAKLDVRLTQVDNGAVQRFDVVSGVPFIVAFPYYVANRATDLLKQETKDNFLPVELGSFDEVDPLGAVSRLYNQLPPKTIVLGGDGSTSGYDLERTFDNYFVDCVAVDHQLRGAPPSSSISNARKMPLDRNFFSNFQVTYAGISTTTFLTRNGNEFGTLQTCPDAHAAILAEVQGILAVQWIAFNEDAGIRQESVAKGMQLILDALTTNVDAQDLQIGLFTAKMVRKGLISSGFQTDYDLMVHQAQQQRMFQKLGERSMFESITKPIITMFEALIFFLTPIYVILLALGSKGIAHMAKYFMLIIFVSLWSYVTIFIDVFTYYLMQATVSPSNGFNPFSFADIPVTMSEVESAIATAAAASQAVPFLLMFLMYGGVHSLMGAMKTMADVKANGKQTAPDISSPMNDGKRELGSVTLNKSVASGVNALGVNTPTNQNFTAFNMSDNLQNVRGVALQHAVSNEATAQRQFQETTSNAYRFATTDNIAFQTANGERYSDSTMKEKIGSVVNQLSSIEGVTSQEAESLALSLAGGLKAGGTLGVGKPGGGSSAGIGLDLQAKLQETATSQEAKSWLAQAGNIESLMDKLTNRETYERNAEQSQSQTEGYVDEYAQVNQALKTRTANLSEAERWTDTLEDQVNKSNNWSLNSSLDLSGYSLSGGFNGRQVFDAMTVSDTGVNEQFTNFLARNYGVTTWDELREREGFASDSAVLGGSGFGSDAGTLNSLFRDFSSQYDTNSSLEDLEAHQEALRRGIGAIRDQLTPDAAGQLKPMEEILNSNEQFLEQMLEKRDANINSSIDRDGIIGRVEGSVPEWNEVERMNLANQGYGLGVVNEAIDNVRNAGNELSNRNVEEEANRIKNAVRMGQEGVNTGTGLASGMKDFLTNVFGEGVQAFNYQMTGGKVMDWVAENNRNAIESAQRNGGSGENVRSVDPLMFSELNKVMDAFRGEGDLSGINRADIVRSSMAVNTLMNNKDELMGQYGVDQKFFDQYSKVQMALDGLLNPNSEDRVFGEYDNYRFKNQGEYEAYQLISEKVSNGEMESSSGLFMMSQMNFGGNRYPMIHGSNAFTEVEKKAFDDTNSGRANAYFDMQRNAADIQAALNAKGITGFDRQLEKMQEERVVTGWMSNEERQQVRDMGESTDAAYKAANLSYAENSVVMGRAPEEGEENVTSGSLEYRTNWLGDNQAYQEKLRGFSEVTSNNPELVEEQRSEGETAKMKAINQNLDDLRNVVSLYGDDVRNNTSSSLSSLAFVGDYATDVEAANKFGTTVGGYPRAVELNKGQGNFVGELTFSGQNYGVYQTSDGAGTYYMKQGSVDPTSGERKGWGVIGDGAGPATGKPFENVRELDGATFRTQREMVIQSGGLTPEYRDNEIGRDAKSYGTSIGGYPNKIMDDVGYADFKGQFEYNGQNYGVYEGQYTGGTYYMKQGSIEADGSRQGWGLLGDGNGKLKGPSIPEARSMNETTFRTEAIMALQEGSKNLISNTTGQALYGFERETNNGNVFMFGSEYTYEGPRVVGDKETGQLFKSTERSNDWFSIESGEKGSQFRFWDENPNKSSK